MNVEVHIMKIVEVVALMLGWYAFHTLPKNFRIFVYYLSLSVISGFIAGFFIDLYGSNYILYHFYSPIEFIVIVIGIFSITNQNSKKKRQAYYIIIPYIIFWLYAQLTFESLIKIGNVSIAVANSIVFLIAVYGSLKISLSSFGSIFNDPRITILIGVLFYFGGSVIIFALSNIIFLGGDFNAKLLWKIHNGLHICFDLFMIYSFYLLIKKSPEFNV